MEDLHLLHLHHLLGIEPEAAAERSAVFNLDLPIKHVSHSDHMTFSQSHTHTQGEGVRQTPLLQRQLKFT